MDMEGETYSPLENAKLFPDSNRQQDDSEKRGEAYYVFIMSALGFVLNFLVMFFILWRKCLRRMTSAFLIHGCLLNILKGVFAVYFAKSLLTQVPPKLCEIAGLMFIIIITTSAFNLVAMACSEAYTFEEMNVGGNYRGSIHCVVFGILLIYFGSLILHLGPTIIAGDIKFRPEIGVCSFEFGNRKSILANSIWIVIISIALGSVIYYTYELYSEIQGNKPNRVSMLVRSSVCLSENPLAERSVKTLVQDSSHRVKLLIGVVILFIACWYPYLFLLIGDMWFNASDKLWLTMCFLSWTHSTLEPMLYICFDRHLYLVSRLVYSGSYRSTYFDGLAPLIRKHRNQRARSSARSNAEGEEDRTIHESGRNSFTHEETGNAEITILRNTSSAANYTSDGPNQLGGREGGQRQEHLVYEYYSQV